jgi:hypothetical protein
MKIIKISFFLLLLFTAFQFSFGQQKPKAEMIHELGLVGGCENYWASIDLLLDKLVDENESVGYIVLYGNKDNVIQTIIYKEWVAGHLKRRKLDDRFKMFDENRLKVVRGKPSANFKIEMWKVSSDAEKSFVEFNTNFEYSLAIKKPLIFYDNNFDPGGLCPYLDSQKVFADFLQANPNLYGNVVIYENSLSNFYKAKKEMLKYMKNISQNRLRFFRSTNSWDGSYELWFIPDK